MSNKSNKSKWNADAEMSMQGFVIPVESEEHLKHMVGYVLFTLSPVYDTFDEDRTSEIVQNAVHRYNSSKQTVKHFTVNNSAFGTLLTFVRDGGSLTTRNGVLAWVENLDAPDCSELGYVYFEKRNGKVSRIA